MVEEHLVPTADLYPGPRKDAVEKVDRDISRESFAMDLHLDMGDEAEAFAAQQRLKSFRLKRQMLLDMSILDLDEAE